MHTQKFLIAILAVVLALPCSLAQVAWEQNDQEMVAKASNQEVPFKFKFTNSSGDTLEIKEVAASCGCTTPEFPKSTIAPGESGAISGIFQIGTRRGTSEVKLTVSGNYLKGDVRRPFSEKLSLKVKIVDEVKISPGILLWRINGAISEKSIIANVAGDAPMDLVFDPKSIEGDYTVRSEVETAGKVFRLIFSPKSTATFSQRELQLNFLRQDGSSFKQTVHLIVR